MFEWGTFFKMLLEARTGELEGDKRWIMLDRVEVEKDVDCLWFVCLLFE